MRQETSSKKVWKNRKLVIFKGKENQTRNEKKLLLVQK